MPSAMTDASLLLPDFLLIALGCFLCRATPLGRPIWDGVERLVYYLLFPALLFATIVRQPLQPGALLSLAGCGLAIVGTGIALAYALGRWPNVDARIHASGAQTAFRFNSYIALALAERLGGAQALALIALLIAVCVPVCNVAAVWPLARHGGHGYVRELVRNPLILATLSGLLVNFTGLPIPDFVSLTLTRLGSAALALGLLAVGAGLQFGALRDAPRLATAFMSIRHVVLPLVAVWLAWLAELPLLQQVVLVSFAALPTASSCYVLAARMGGHGPFVAGLVTLSTLLAMPGLPLALYALRWVPRPG